MFVNEIYITINENSIAVFGNVFVCCERCEMTVFNETNFDGV
tara:strand:+ start:1270 stop:1395 length:126 start_codon:yes stop_codon:yes gene_type:complete